MYPHNVGNMRAFLMIEAESSAGSLASNRNRKTSDKGQCARNKPWIVVECDESRALELARN